MAKPIYTITKKDLIEMKKQLEISLKQIENEIKAFTTAVRTAELNRLGCVAAIERINRGWGK